MFSGRYWTQIPLRKTGENALLIDLAANALQILAECPELELLVDSWRSMPSAERSEQAKSIRRLIREMVADGWEVHLVYLWLPTVEACVERVAERVAQGGHNIPEATIRRRYTRSLKNLLNKFATAFSVVACYDNSSSVPRLIFTQTGPERRTNDPGAFRLLLESVHQ